MKSFLFGTGRREIEDSRDAREPEFIDAPLPHEPRDQTRQSTEQLLEEYAGKLLAVDGGLTIEDLATTLLRFKTQREKFLPKFLEKATNTDICHLLQTADPKDEAFCDQLAVVLMSRNADEDALFAVMRYSKKTQKQAWELLRVRHPSPQVLQKIITDIQPLALLAGRALLTTSKSPDDGCFVAEHVQSLKEDAGEQIMVNHPKDHHLRFVIEHIPEYRKAAVEAILSNGDPGEFTLCVIFQDDKESRPRVARMLLTRKRDMRIPSDILERMLAIEDPEVYELAAHEILGYSGDRITHLRLLRVLMHKGGVCSGDAAAALLALSEDRVDHLHVLQQFPDLDPQVQAALKSSSLTFVEIFTLLVADERHHEKYWPLFLAADPNNTYLLKVIESVPALSDEAWLTYLTLHPEPPATELSFIMQHAASADARRDAWHRFAPHATVDLLIGILENTPDNVLQERCWQAIRSEAGVRQLRRVIHSVPSLRLQATQLLRTHPERSEADVTFLTGCAHAAWLASDGTLPEQSEAGQILEQMVALLRQKEA